MRKFTSCGSTLQVEALRLQDENTRLRAELQQHRRARHLLQGQETAPLLLRVKRISFERFPGMLSIPPIASMQDCGDAGILFLPEIVDGRRFASLLDAKWENFAARDSLAYILVWCIFHVGAAHAGFEDEDTHAALRAAPEFAACCQLVRDALEKVALAMYGAFLHSASQFGDEVVAAVSFYDSRVQMPVFWNALGKVLEGSRGQGS